VSTAIASVGSIRRWTADAALQAVAGAETDSSHGVLLRAFRERVIEAWQARVALDLLPTSSDLPLRLLRAALEDAHDRCCWIAFQALEQVEDPGVVRSIRKALDYESASDRVRALEALTNLGEREPASQLALLLEQEPITVKLSALPVWPLAVSPEIQKTPRPRRYAKWKVCWHCVESRSSRISRWSSSRHWESSWRRPRTWRASWSFGKTTKARSST
jgi:hypothetical protein